ncbi:MAG TPA: MraY family glycosyltransferase [Alphaproteobacteria bacterium]
MTALIYSIIAFSAVAVLIPAARALARAKGFVDRPGGRKKHEDEVPPVGGLVIFPVFMTVAALAGIDAHTMWFFLGLALLLVTGALDDRHQLPPRVKFTAQIATALLIVIPGGATVITLGNLFGTGPVYLGWGGAVFAAVAAVLLINAINLMDGIDGLAAGIGFIILFWLAVAGGNIHVPVMMGALGGFLLYNMRRPGRARASVFMGDAGSLALGLSLAWFSIHLSQGLGAVIKPAAVAWLLALPIYDTCGQFARRVRQGRHPFEPDHDHFHHHFLYAGFTPGQATAIILSISFLFGAVGICGAAAGVPDYVLGYVWFAGLLTHIYMSMRPHRFRRLLLRLRGGTEMPQ